MPSLEVETRDYWLGVTPTNGESRRRNARGYGFVDRGVEDIKLVVVVVIIVVAVVFVLPSAWIGDRV